MESDPLLKTKTSVKDLIQRIESKNSFTPNKSPIKVFDITDKNDEINIQYIDESSTKDSNYINSYRSYQSNEIEVNKTSSLSKNWLLLVFKVFLYLFLLYLCYYFYTRQIQNTNTNKKIEFNDGDKVFIRLSNSGKLDKNSMYLRINKNGDIVADKTFPYLHGSSFIIHSSSSYNQSWVLKPVKSSKFNIISTINKDNLDLLTTLLIDSTPISSYPITGSNNEEQPTIDIPSDVLESEFNSLNTIVMSDTTTIISNEQSHHNHYSKYSKENLYVKFYWSFENSGYVNYNKINQSPLDNSNDKIDTISVFTVEDFPTTTYYLEKYEALHGVNLGSWFIPERWLNPSFYDGVSMYWSQICGLRHELGLIEAETRILHHIDTWVTEKDFDSFVFNGINSIRIPLGYWNVIDDPFEMMVPTHAEDSLKYVDWAFDQAEKRGISVLLDYHALPGAQNEFDHSGCGYYGTHWNDPQNIEISYQVLHTLLKRYVHRPSLIGIELINEPSLKVEQLQHEELKEYYKNGYAIVREYSDSLYVIISELWDTYYESWNTFQEPEYYNFIVDWHMYYWEDELGSDRHILKAKLWHEWINKYKVIYPIMVGEWSISMSFDNDKGTQEYLNEELSSFDDTWGWYYWNFKVNTNNRDVWSFDAIIKKGFKFNDLK